MKIGPRKFGGAECEVRFVPGVPDHMKHETRLICNLFVAPALRRKGQATELMNRIATDADGKRVILILNPDPFDDNAPDLPQLVEWYASLGFQEIQKFPLLMARMFNIPQMIDAADKITSIILEGTQ